MIRFRVLAILLLSIASPAVVSCSTAETLLPLGQVGSVNILLGTTTLAVGQTVSASASVLDGAGAVLPGRTVTWSSSDAGTATVSDGGVVTALAPGSTAISAASEGKSASTAVTVVALSPAAVASVTVTLNSASLTPGQTTQATATTRDASNTVLTGRVVVWTSGNPGVATVSSSGLVTAVAAGTALITATSEGKSGSAPLTVTAAPPPPPSGSVEPAGLTRITERAFSAPVEDGWTLPAFAVPYFRIVQDPTAPRSAGSVSEIRYPVGFAGGDSPALVERDLGSKARTLYVAMWIKLSPNWLGHPTGTNKVMHFWINGINRVFFFLDGAASNVLQPRIGLQGIAAPYAFGNGKGTTTTELPPNLPDPTNAAVVRGQWYRAELLLTANTPGVADGSVEWWLNGTKVGSYTGIMYAPSGAPNVWEVTKYDPTWGGLGGVIPTEQFLWMDHLYISGK